jgi:OmpA-OmpF porin, OOP family
MMKISRTILALLCLSNTFTFAQDETSYKQQPALGIHFILHDFQSATNIRNSSLSRVLANKEFGKVKEMSPGLAISYSEGLHDNFDVAVTLAGAFLDYPRENAQLSGSDKFLLEADASVRGKMFSDKYWFTPYLQAGIGVSKFKGYYGAIIPLGVGLQVNFFDEAFLLINSQYRVPVTQSASYHFYHSIGLAGNIGRKKPRE